MVSRRTIVAAAAGAAALLGVVGAVAAASASTATVLVTSTTYWDVYSTATWYAANGATLAPLLPYLDDYTTQIGTDFGYSVFPLPGGQAKLALVLDPAITNAASTGTPLGLEGVTVAANTVGEVWDSIAGYLYYIFSLHETVNDWTGALASGWPWADGSSLWAGTSPFPTACDIIITEELGYTAISEAHRAEESSDQGVQLFLNLQSTYGWAAFRQFFALVSKNGITNWTAYPEPLRTAIIAWFFTQTTGVDQLDNFNAAVLADSGQTIPLTTYEQAQSMFPS
jgi:hypothetical protein